MVHMHMASQKPACSFLTLGSGKLQALVTIFAKAVFILVNSLGYASFPKRKLPKMVLHVAKAQVEVDHKPK